MFRLGVKDCYVWGLVLSRFWVSVLMFGGSGFLRLGVSFLTFGGK